MRALEGENSRLKKIVADLTLDREMASLVRHWSEDNGERTSFAESFEAWPDGELVRGICIDWGVSIRGAFGAIRFDTSTFHYKSRRSDQAAVERRINEIAGTRVRYGYRRVHVLLRREGWEINMKKTHRIYNELGLQLRNKHPRRRVKAKYREDRQEAAGPNEAWAMHFIHDQLAIGKKLRILTVVDTHSRVCPAADPRFAYRGEDVVQTLERVCAKVG